MIIYQPQEVIKEEATVSFEVVEETDDTLQVKNKTLTKDLSLGVDTTLLRHVAV